ncbi:chromate transporter, partial [Alloalcanivorax gelatiniphagus]|uniref:chromate transporter n=1 Tax=Alloalcanivorax gelatiniphagus TaxID=1194167 RepID=UPI00197AA2B6
MWMVFREFLWLGCVSFGGPAAHVGYFHRRFVATLGWLDEAAFARLMALSQFLPGPASSQLGFAIGRHQAGLAGAVAAFVGFTLPSFLLMLALALYATHLPGAVLAGLVQGLKWLAVVVVADAVLTLGGKFCQDRLTPCPGVAHRRPPCGYGRALPPAGGGGGGGPGPRPRPRGGGLRGGGDAPSPPDRGPPPRIRSALAGGLGETRRDRSL